MTTHLPTRLEARLVDVQHAHPHGGAKVLRHRQSKVPSPSADIDKVQRCNSLAVANATATATAAAAATYYALRNISVGCKIAAVLPELSPN